MNIFLLYPYRISIVFFCCVFTVIYISSHPPPPKTSIEQVKIIESKKLVPIVEKIINTNKIYITTTPRQDKLKIMGKADPRVKFIAQAGQDKYVNKLLIDKKINTGVFVEFGGYMGDEYSNSWFFEKSYNWKGIMVEVEKKYISRLKRVRPNAIIYNNAVCPTGVDTITFAESKLSGWSGIVDKYDDPRWHRQIKKTYQVKCVDLNVILEENNMFHVDYMTVDTEGSEIDILETFRFDKFDITYIQVERNVKTITQKKRKNYLIQFMKKNGYELEKVFDIGNEAIDVLFKKSI